MRGHAGRAPGAVVGVGVDLCAPRRLEGVRERWRGRAQRIFSERELADFPGGTLAVPWAAREATLKALGMPSVLGAPLADLQVAPGPLRLTPGPAVQGALEARGIVHVALSLASVAGVVLVVAVALAAPGAAPLHTWSWAALPAPDDASAAARRAGFLAARDLVPGARPEDAHWGGGHDRAPTLSLPGAPPLFVSLTHDGGLAAAVVAAPLGARR